MTVLWYVEFSYYSWPENSPWGSSAWDSHMGLPDFSVMGAYEITLVVLEILIPVIFFVIVLFFAEFDLKWMTVPLLIPVVWQTLQFIHFWKLDVDYLSRNPFSFIAPFAALILLALTFTGVIPTKIPGLVLCGAAVIAPLVLTLLGEGEFVNYYGDYGVTAYRWSHYLYYALYFLALGALLAQIRRPKPEEADGTETAAPTPVPAETDPDTVCEELPGDPDPRIYPKDDLDPEEPTESAPETEEPPADEDGGSLSQS